MCSLASFVLYHAAVLLLPFSFLFSPSHYTRISIFSNLACYLKIKPFSMSHSHLFCLKRFSTFSSSIHLPLLLCYYYFTFYDCFISIDYNSTISLWLMVVLRCMSCSHLTQHVCLLIFQQCHANELSLLFFSLHYLLTKESAGGF